MAWQTVRKLYHYSKLAQHRRRKFIDWRWRAIVFFLVLILFAYADWYLQNNYFVVVDQVAGKLPFLLSHRLLEWFSFGFFAGFFIFVVLAEGEFLIGLRAVTRELEKQFGGFERTLQHLEKGVSRAVTTPAKGRRKKR